MTYKAVIGLETHVQLNTNSKMFSSSSAKYQNSEPNTLVDPTTMGLPGALPVVNIKAVESAINRESGVVGWDEESNNKLCCIDFSRIKGSKPFNTKLDWYLKMKKEIYNI